MSSIYDFSANSLQGQPIDFSQFQGKPLLIVNTASKCGFTYQYEGLQKLHEEYGEQGLQVLGFPCNQFGEQEKGNSEEITEFCQVNYGVGFQMFEKIDVNGDNAHPLYKWLKSQKRGFLGTEKIKWNFTKFLVNKDGQVIKRYGSTTKPEKMVADIKTVL